MALITKTDIKPFLKIDTADYDALLETIASQASKFIDTRLNRALDSTSYYEIYSGNGETNLILDNYPIISITRISQDISITDRTYGDVIDLNNIAVDNESGVLEYVDTVWVKSARSIYIEYTAGYTTYPDDLQMVAINLATKKFNDVEEKRQGITTKNIMQENISFDLSDLTREDLKTLNLWRKKPYKNGISVSAFSAA